MSYTLHGPKSGGRLWKALIAAKYVGVEIAVTENFEMGVDNKKPEFLAKNPLGKVPVLETPEGCIFESNAIARYVARLDESAHLLGHSAYESALVNQWIDFSVGEVELPATAWLYPIFGRMENNPDITSKAKGDVRKALTILNTHLLSRTFLVGERITLADIVMSCTLYYLYTMVLDPGFRKAFANVNRWFTTCVNQPNFNAVMGEVVLCTKAAVAPAAKKEEKPKEEKKPQEEKKPKEEKKKPEKKPKKEEEDDDEDEQPKNRPANPLDLLPPSPWVLDDWKRAYSNSSDYVATLKSFWETLDRNGWCLYFAEYKDNAELSKLLFTCNLIGGFIQRLDPLRKYGFGCVVICGDEEKGLEISACFLFRGNDIPAEMRDCPDFDSYEFSKVDIEDEAQRKKVELMWTWEGDWAPRTFNQGRVFK